MKKNDYKYQNVIKENLGKDYFIKVGYIKEDQCVYCKKYKGKECRLKIEEGKCVNYESARQDK